MKRSVLRALAERFVTSWATPPMTAEDETLRGVLNWFAGYESCSRRHRHDRARWRLRLEAANREIHTLQLENLALRLDRLECPGRPMTLADIVDPWRWAYIGHVLPNGSVFTSRWGTPVWCSNCPTWHGV